MTNDPFLRMAVAASVAAALEELGLPGPKEKPATMTTVALTGADPGVVGRKVIEHLDRMGYEVIPRRSGP